jgi:2-desacetyl-2-hydroxyethyl bacteriochlorophyllide A dehydrogenase
VVLKVNTCGVCGTDSHIYQGEFLVRFPVVPGHELSGEVVEVGSSVTHVAVGDWVTVDPNIVCGVCPYCRVGQINLCDNLHAVGVRMDGGFAGYCRAPAKQVYRLPEGMSLLEGAFAEPLACCLHGTDRAGLRAGDRVLVIGGGSIGLTMVQLALAAGASHVILSEPSESRRGLGVVLGATAALNPVATDVRGEVLELTEGGADLVIECAGTARTAEQAVACARKGGRVLFFGVAPEAAIAELRPYDIFLRELTILGSFVNPFTHQRALEALAKGRVKVEPLVSHRYPVAAFEEALAMSRSPQAVKVVVQPSLEEAAV